MLVGHHTALEFRILGSRWPTAAFQFGIGLLVGCYKVGQVPWLQQTASRLFAIKKSKLKSNLITLTEKTVVYLVHNIALISWMTVDLNFSVWQTHLETKH